MTIRKKINPRQRRFCQEYVIDYNATRAAIAAGYAPKHAANHTWELLNSPAIKVYIAELMAETQNKLAITAERVLNELARLAFHDPAVYYKKDAKGREVLKDISELTPDQTAAITEFDAATKRLRLADKLPALDKLGKHLKLFTELHEQQHTFTIMPVVRLDGEEHIFNVGSPKPKK